MLQPTRTPFLFAHGTIFKRPDDKKQGPSAENSHPAAQFDASPLIPSCGCRWLGRWLALYDRRAGSPSAARSVGRLAAGRLLWARAVE